MLLIVAAASALVGLVLLLATDGTGPTGAAIGFFALAGILAMSAAFYAVGRSEDRARARERSRRD